MHSPKKNRLLIFGLLAPTVLLLGGLTIYPLLFNLYLSFTSLTLLNYKAHTASFVGFANYAAVLSTPRFWNALRVTLVYVGSTVIFGLILSFALALFFWNRPRLQRYVTTLIMVPHMAAPVVVGLVWKLILNSDIGVVNYLLGLLGIQPRSWLSDLALVLPVVVGADMWQHVPFMYLSLTGGLTALPKDPFEAGEVDGANRWQILRHITLPLMKPVTLVVLVFRTMGAFITFDLVYVLTGGGPGTSSELISLYLYRVGFSEWDFGKAGALSIVILIMVGALSALMIKLVQDQQEN